MKHRDPIRIQFLPDWLVKSIGRATVEKADSIDELNLDSLTEQDQDIIKLANTTFAYWLYASRAPLVKYQLDTEIINLGNVEQGAAEINNKFDNLIKVIYGENHTYTKTTNKDEKYEILCRAFQDVKILTKSNGDIIVFNDEHSNTWHDRHRLLRAICKHLIDTIGFKEIASTKLFESYLNSSFTTMDEIHHLLAHKVG